MAMEQAGIRRSQKSRQVGDYRLESLLFEGPHLPGLGGTARLAREGRAAGARLQRRTCRGAVSRETIQRAAKREFQILEGISHPGIPKAEGYTEHSLGPALIFEHDPTAVRLDHYLKERASRMTVDQRLDFVRQIAEAVQYAHDKKLAHRALSPRSILVRKPDSKRPALQVFNWQTGARRADSQTSGQSYHLFSGQAPAPTFYEMMDRIREEKGLKLSSVLDRAGEELQVLVQVSTYPEVGERFSSVRDFLSGLEEVEAELTRPDTDEGYVPDPTQAKKGDRLENGLVVEKRLGNGATAVGLLVSRDERRYVLKVALTSEQNERLEEEGEVLKRLRHPFRAAAPRGGYLCFAQLAEPRRTPAGGGRSRPGVQLRYRRDQHARARDRRRRSR